MAANGAICAGDVIFVFSLCILCVLCIVGNITVILTILGTPSLRSGSSLLLLNLGVCDLLYGIIRISMLTDSFLYGGWRFSQTVCSFTAISTSLFSVVSILTITVIALDRYLSIIHCLRYSSWSPMMTTALALTSTWVIGLVSSIPSITGIWGSVTYDPKLYLCYVKWNTHLSYAIFQFLMTYLVPIITMGYSYLRIIAVARSHAKKITDLNAHVNRTSGETTVPPHGIVAFAVIDPVRRLPVMGFPVASTRSLIDFDLSSFNGNGLSHSSTEKSNNKQKAMIRLLGHILALIICWTPFVISELQFLSKQDSFKFSAVLSMITTWLLCLHAAWNPYIYAILSGRFRKCALKLAGSKKFSVTRVKDFNRSMVIGTITHRRPQVGGVIRPVGTKSETTHVAFSDQHNLKSKVSHLDVPTTPQSYPSPETKVYTDILRRENNYSTKKGLSSVPETLLSVESLVAESLDEGIFLDDETNTKRESK
ncbi:5-hydroxytryptamine receptor 1B-like [Saccostrea echinata]|uniref:5-hydroxytryptamine receptor 1B-like n=1 Tax=Saccostrea echinata TaxID=191078 RepID=UPI002A80493C|nr:5-hydroxytryptamine receptor 1B-like [Saccostrea echinata]